MTQSDSSNFIVADDHPLFREALIHAIHNCVPCAVIHEADSLASLSEVVEANPDADLLFLDLHMPGVSGFSALALSLIHISEPTRLKTRSRMPSSA